MTSWKSIFEAVPYTHTPNPLAYLGAPHSLCVSSPAIILPPHPSTYSLTLLSPPQEGTAQKVEATEWRQQTALDKESSLSPLLHPQLCLQLATGQQASAPV